MLIIEMATFADLFTKTLVMDYRPICQIEFFYQKI